MTGDERYQLVLARLNRAGDHMKELITAVNEYHRKEPYKLGFKVGGHFVDSIDKVPTLIPILIGDVLHNLRCCLDHMAYQLVWGNVGSPPADASSLNFPICESATKYSNRKNSGDPFFEGASAAAIAAVDSLKPYKGGNEPFWWLSRLNNIDKHRMLVTVCGKATSIDLGLARDMVKSLERDMSFPEDVRQAMIRAAEELAKKPLFFNMDPMFPLKAGDVFYDSEFNPDVKLKVHLALDEGDTPPEPIEQLLRTIGAAVENAINTLRPCLE